MGLDAFVHCDCFEKGRLRAPPPAGVRVLVAEDGSLEHENDGDELELDIAFDRWVDHEACEHEGGWLIHHRLGNMSWAGLMRAELGRRTQDFPIILGKVIHNGTHCGDWLDLGILDALEKEVQLLGAFKTAKKKEQPFVDYFREQLQELIDAARQVGKPIVF